MKKVIFLVLILAVVSAGVVFAEDDNFSSMPKNAITVDFAPLIAGLSFGATSSIISGVGDLLLGSGNDLSSMADFKTTGFGIGAQYERQLMDKVSVAGRFAYMSMGTGLILGDFGKTNIDISSFSIEAHIRYFFDDSMFVDGMLGYANMTAKFSYEATTPDLTNPLNTTVKKDEFDVPKDYLKLGIKLGWRIDFGEPGGFIFEPVIGWSFGIGAGDSIVKKAAKSLGQDLDKGTSDILDAVTWGIDNLIFVGGPRLTLAVGWRF